LVFGFVDDLGIRVWPEFSNTIRVSLRSRPCQTSWKLFGCLTFKIRFINKNKHLQILKIYNSLFLAWLCVALVLCQGELVISP
jgi:hypothetical protein